MQSRLIAQMFDAHHFRRFAFTLLDVFRTQTNC